MSDFSDKNILIIGGTSGIGAALFERLMETEAIIFMASRKPPDERVNKKVKHISLDVLSLGDELDEVPDELHGLVYLPGTITLKPFQGLKAENFLHDYEINVLGAIKVIEKCIKKLKGAGGSSIVLFSTVAAQLGLNYHTSVAAAKGALEGFGRSLAAEFASKQVRVNLIAPSLTDTPLAKNLLSSEDKKEASDQRHPIGRYGQPGDIANMAFYLLSDQSSWITGQVLHVDGGLSTLKTL
ncbi:3-oxoacyl-[acyl-carrier protein] reductase [Catalinimonas alkaloidigena]|uniref:SDR family NAD(P)-dependent oxidoreductase n=1 Tax=Catalinimonas alkaloidigena TaxID=1075417 RepID=UPI002404918F|nr:SDR family oxidoreductase [Catalinimonas alkaloidigena]MDF9797295.1 3-oxoacyl-[acyl-carrier protein] reductase [Catalinimonas alkaloidigena]